MIFKRNRHFYIDVTSAGVRYREALGTKDHREAKTREKKRIAEIESGKGASKHGRDFARKPFREAAAVFLSDRKSVSERTLRFEGERIKPLLRFFGERPLLRLTAQDVSDYQARRQADGVSNRTINMEVGLLRRMMKKGKVWARVVEDVSMLPEDAPPIARVLDPGPKRRLFEIAAGKPDWLVAHCAAVLAASTTCRSVELRHLRWQDVDLFERVMHIRRSKTLAGHRNIPLNGDALAALRRLWERAQLHGATDPSHYIFPACEHKVDPTRPQKTWRTAWRSLTAAAGLKGFRFHDLRHQAITELAEAGAADATLMALAGHMSREMLEHYSHVRMDAKRMAVDKLESGLMGATLVAAEPTAERVN